LTYNEEGDSSGSFVFSEPFNSYLSWSIPNEWKSTASNDGTEDAIAEALVDQALYRSSECHQKHSN